MSLVLEGAADQSLGTRVGPLGRTRLSHQRAGTSRKALFHSRFPGTLPEEHLQPDVESAAPGRAERIHEEMKEVRRSRRAPTGLGSLLVTARSQRLLLGSSHRH